MKEKITYVSYDGKLTSDDKEEVEEYEHRALQSNLVYENDDHNVFIFKVDDEDFADCLIENLSCGYTEWIEFPNYVVVELYRGRATSLKTYRESGLFRDKIAEFKGDGF